MKEPFLLNKLLRIHQGNIISFHTPGHKNGKIFDKVFLKEFKNQLPYIDTTEIIGTDNLHNPKGIIKKAQEEAKEVFKSEETYFLINGSTCGIYSMIMGTTSPGDKIIIDRNCHQSVINAIILGELTPEYLYPEMDIENAIALGISPAMVEKKVMENPDAKAVVITYPTYHGIASDLKKIAEIVHRYDKVLLVDEAHGAHLGLSEELPMAALECGADVVVQSTHKTLPTLTQASMLHLQGGRIDREKIRFMLRLHQSSSPSYILMASLDLAVNIYKNHGKRLMEELLHNIKIFKSKIKEIEEISLMKDNIVGKYGIKAIDITKLWISIKNNKINGYELENILRKKYHIQMELSNIYGILALTTIGNDKEDFEGLLMALADITEKKEEKANKNMPCFLYPMAKRVYTPREALYRKKQKMRLEESIGYISGEYLTPYPPGVPILIPGEIIDENMIRYVREMIFRGIEIIGLKDQNCEFIEVIDIKG